MSFLLEKLKKAKNAVSRIGRTKKSKGILNDDDELLEPPPQNNNVVPPKPTKSVSFANTKPRNNTTLAVSKPAVAVKNNSATQTPTFTTSCASKCPKEQIVATDPPEEKLRKIIMNGDAAQTISAYGLEGYLDQYKFVPIYTVRMPAFDQSATHSDDQVSPFMLAIAMQNADVFEQIFRRSAQPPTVAEITAGTPQLGNTALHLAASRNNTMFQELWSTYKHEDVPIDIANKASQTPLMFAARFCAPRNALFIIENSDFAQIDAKDSSSKTAADYAEGYYVPADSSQRVVRELAKRSSDIAVFFADAQMERQKIRPYLETVQPHAPEAVRLMQEVLRNSNKRVSPSNVNALMDAIVNDKNSALYTSAKTNTSAFKKLEKLAISLESKSNSSEGLPVLLDVLKREPSLLPQGNGINLDGPKTDVIAALKTLLGAADNAQLKIKLIDLILKKNSSIGTKIGPLAATTAATTAFKPANIKTANANTPKAANIKSTNANATNIKAANSTIINTNTASLPKNHQPVVNMLAELTIRGIVSAENYEKARVIAKGNANNLEAFIKDLQFMNMYPENDLMTLMNQVIIDISVGQLEEIDVDFEKPQTIDSDAVFAVDMAVITAKLPKALQSADADKLNDLMIDYNAGRDNPSAFVDKAKALRAQSSLKFAKLRRYIDDSFAITIITERLVEKSNSNTKSRFVNPLLRALSLDDDIMNWTVDETLNMILQNAKNNNSNKYLETFQDHLMTFLATLESFKYNPNVNTLIDNLNAWIVNLNAIYKLSKAANAGNIRLDSNMRSKTWAQIKNEISVK